MKDLKSCCISLLRPVFFLLVLFIGSSFLNSKNTTCDRSLSIADLTCEFTTNPIGLDIKYPQFSWQIKSVRRGSMQSAYQILIADSPEKLARGEGTVWNSGRGGTSISAGIR